jgi:hypothetical protein
MGLVQDNPQYDLIVILGEKQRRSSHLTAEKGNSQIPFVCWTQLWRQQKSGLVQYNPLTVIPIKIYPLKECI